MSRLLLFCLLSLGSASLQAEKSLLMGQIENPSSARIQLFYQHNSLPLPDTYLYEAELDADNRFFFVLELADWQRVYLRYEGEELPVEIKAGDRVELRFQAAEPWQSLHFEGESAAWNQAQLDLQRMSRISPEDLVRLPPSFELSTRDFEQIRQLSPQRFVDWLEKTEKERANFIWMFPGLTDTQQRLLLQRLHYRFLAIRLLYPRYSRFDAVPPDYFHFLENESIEQPTLLPFSGYRHFLEEYLHRAAGPQSTAQRVAWIQQHWQSEVGAYKICELLLRALQREGWEVHKDFITTFLAQQKTNRYTTALEGYLAQLQQIEGQQKAPLFCVESPSRLCLEELRGKLVYLSFWASWCAPCVEEMLRTKEKLQRLAGPEIAFVYLSLDKEQEAWRQALERFDFAGQHYWMGEASAEIRAAYQVQAVPLYFLIDQQGRFVPYSKKLGDEAFEKQLQRLLKK